ncbi:hypothetical protein [Kribbella italica]|uniref:Uncharacterized protein n=1 Tax=Kribbella italica TaxID=1540520 RepID=A0A7W9MV88_9ACTN|nr:hypothetical protein [Kribbella italica]MBB5837676.1 hypothetical protein [Kribbella italica]
MEFRAVREVRVMLPSAVESLRGVTIAGEQVDQLAAALVADLGITVDGRY